MENVKFHIGTSGYNNLPWKGIFYPDDIPRSQWFGYYCKHFDTFEINSSFHKFPTAKSLSNWYKKSPDNFRFAVKAPKLLTHYRRFRECRDKIAEFYEVTREGLAEKATVILFQFPPSFKFDPETLELVLGQLDRNFLNAVEFRHPSWWIPEVFTAFEKNGTIFCNVSYPRLPAGLVATNPVGYVRLHGVPNLFYSDYDSAYIRSLIDRILAGTFSEAYVFFNNTASESGILNALAARKMAGTNVIKV